jgi:hypothetical protein
LSEREIFHQLCRVLPFQNEVHVSAGKRDDLNNGTRKVRTPAGQKETGLEAVDNS